MTSKWGKLCAAVVGCGMSTGAFALEFNLQTPESPIAHQIYELHTLIMAIIVVIFLVVFGTMTYSIIKHRKSVGHQAAQFHENTTIEIIWTVIPFLILIGMAYPATKTVIEMKDTSHPDLTIKVTGYQWMWNYDYLNDGISFYSHLSTPRSEIDGGNVKGRDANPYYLLQVDHPMVVPVGKKVRIITTAGDVIHSWWVPALGVKQDAFPGVLHDTWFTVQKPGMYRGQCAELCGKDHGFMPIVVKAVEPAQFVAWVKEQKAKTVSAEPSAKKVWTLAELKSHGEKVYSENCVACHQANGRGVPNTFPALSGDKVVNGPKIDHIKTVLNGRPGTPMPSWKRLSDLDIAAVITYERNSWANHTGDMVTPAEVKAAR